MISCWPTYVAFLFFGALFLYDISSRNWTLIPLHAFYTVFVTVSLTLVCSLFGETVSGFILLVPMLVVLVYLLVKYLQKEEAPIPVPEPPPTPPPSGCIDPYNIPDCQKLVQVYVSKEDAALARCRRREAKKKDAAAKQVNLGCPAVTK
jgi:hypothetical protein